MYIGAVERGPIHLFHEVFDNALDEATAGHCDTIYVDLSEDLNKLVIRDNGRGFPDNRNEEGIHDIVTSCTVAHSSGKFHHGNYSKSIGLNGIGITACNAVSSLFQISSVRNGVKSVATFKQAILDTGDVVQTKVKEPNGVEVTVVADPEIFTTTTKFDKSMIFSRLQLAVSFCNVTILFNGKEVSKLSQEDMSPKIETTMFEVSATHNKILVEKINGTEHSQSIEESALVKFGYNLRSTKIDTHRGSVNLLRVDSGAHIRVFERAMIEAWQSLVSKDVKEYLNPYDYLLGLSGFIYVSLSDPSYTSQIKDNLSGSIVEYRYLVNALTPEIVKVLKSDQKLFNALVNKFMDYRKNLNRLGNSNYLDEMIELGDSGTSTSRKLDTSSKLIDCLSKNRDSTELFICEGNSASSNLLPFRDKQLHAILPLRGKVKNIIDLDIKSIVSNKEIRSLINAMGTGCFHKEDPDRCRYEKICIVTDSDDDGKNIQALLLGVFLYCTPKTLDSGRVYISDTPLFGYRGNVNELIPVWDESEYRGNVHLERFKGLGSFDADELSPLVFDKSVRRLRQVTMDDAQEALRVIKSSSAKKQLMKDNGVLL